MIFLIILGIIYILTLIWVIICENRRKKEMIINDKDLIFSFITLKGNTENGLIHIKKNSSFTINQNLYIYVRFNKIDELIVSMKLEWIGSFGEDDMIYFLDELK